MSNKVSIKNNIYPTNLILSIGLNPEYVCIDDFVNAIERLPDSDIDIIIMRYKDFFEISDIACIMEKSEGQITYKLERELEWLEYIYMKTKSGIKMKYDIYQDELIRRIRDEYANMPVVDITDEDKYNEIEEYSEPVYDEIEGLKDEEYTIKIDMPKCNSTNTDQPYSNLKIKPLSCSIVIMKR